MYTYTKFMKKQSIVYNRNGKCLQQMVLRKMDSHIQKHKTTSYHKYNLIKNELQSQIQCLNIKYTEKNVEEKMLHTHNIIHDIQLHFTHIGYSTPIARKPHEKKIRAQNYQIKKNLHILENYDKNEKRNGKISHGLKCLFCIPPILA